MRMKRSLLLILLAILTNFELIAQTSQSNGKKILIGFIGRNQYNSVFSATFSGAHLAAKELSAKHNVNITIDQYSPDLDNAEEQAEIIQKLCQLGVDAIIISCSNPKILTPVINKAVSQGIVVICFESDAPASNRLAYFGTGDLNAGKTLVSELAQIKNGICNMGILAGNRNTLSTQHRIQGIIEQLKDYPSMKLAQNGIIYAEETPEISYESLNKAQRNNPNIDAWILLNSLPLLTKKPLNIGKPGIDILACEASVKELDYIRNNEVKTILIVNYYQIGYRIVESIINKILFNNEPISKTMVESFTLVTKRNVDEWSLTLRKWMLKDALSKD